MREAIGLSDLAKDFRFAQKHGVESSGNAEEMPHGFAVVMVI